MMHIVASVLSVSLVNYYIGMPLENGDDKNNVSIFSVNNQHGYGGSAIQSQTLGFGLS